MSRAASAKQCNAAVSAMADAFQSLLRLAEMNGGALLLDAGQDEALAVDVATESIVCTAR